MKPEEDSWAKVLLTQVVWLTVIVGVVLLLTSVMGCGFRSIDSKDIVAHTRGIPIVNLVIEGPGGDLVPITYTKIKEHVLVFVVGTSFWFAFGVFCGAAVLWRVLRGKRGE